MEGTWDFLDLRCCGVIDGRWRSRSSPPGSAEKCTSWRRNPCCSLCSNMARNSRALTVPCYYNTAARWDFRTFKSLPALAGPLGSICLCCELVICQPQVATLRLPPHLPWPDAWPGLMTLASPALAGPTYDLPYDQPGTRTRTTYCTVRPVDLREARTLVPRENAWYGTSTIKVYHCSSGRRRSEYSTKRVRNV